MALRLGRLCGNGPEIWLNLQAQCDLALARARSAAQLEAVEPLG
jgi:plasmid maintenance system antidote protein VapI